MKQAILEVRNLTKRFYNKDGEFIAVDNLSFSIADGEILGLLGPNGAGKTTTIQMLLGVMEATSGEITFFGKPFLKHREEILSQINFCSTYISLPWLFTVQEILDTYARLYEVKDKKKRIAKLTEEFELETLLRKQFFMLSAGEKTRLIIAKSFINFPKLLLLDEPTASLDPEIAVKIREFLKKERKEYNVSMLLTSHNMAEVEEMCDRVIILHEGKIIDEDTPENLAKNITECEIELLIKDQTEKAKKFLDQTGMPFHLHKSRFTITLAEKNIADLLITLAKQNIEYQEISINKPDLEDYFLQVITQRKAV
jgi:ABC-2 type transport system ATP-binding protein